MNSSPKAGSSRDNCSNMSKNKSSTNNNLEVDEHNALCRATDGILQKTITSDEHLSGLPPDCTLEELQAEIALARGQATTIFVKREGLSTLKVVLPQQDPTIANLKRAIERTANLLQQRKRSSTSDDHEKARETNKSSTDTPPRRISNGALISAAHPGRTHRSNPSWRFLWRAYCLSGAAAVYKEHAEPTLLDSDGRQLLSDFGIGHKSVLRFVKRENYFGRQRQRN